MRKIRFNNTNHKIILIFFLFYLLIFFGFYLNEDSLGGAQNDFNYHYNITLSFMKNFSDSFRDFGTQGSFMGTRNSPVFWIILSQISKIFSYDILRMLNSSASIFICLYFFKCLKIRFKHFDSFVLMLIACVVFLSPTVRSLSIWPYSLIWGLLFFVISIYHFLKFLNEKREIEKFKQSLISIFFVVIGAYIYPAFGIFFTFYLVNFFLKYNFKKKFFLILFFSFFLAIPFLYYIFSKDVIAAFGSAQGMYMDNFNTFNISNKILIISTMIFFFIAPVLNFELIKKEIIGLKSLEIFILIIFCFINIYYFNYPEYDSGFGGGFFINFQIFFQMIIFSSLFQAFCCLYLYNFKKV